MDEPHRQVKRNKENALLDPLYEVLEQANLIYTNRNKEGSVLIRKRLK